MSAAAAIVFLGGLIIGEKSMMCRSPHLMFPDTCKAKTAELPSHEMSLKLNPINIVTYKTWSVLWLAISSFPLPITLSRPP